MTSTAVLRAPPPAWPSRAILRLLSLTLTAFRLQADLALEYLAFRLQLAVLNRQCRRPRLRRRAKGRALPGRRRQPVRHLRELALWRAGDDLQPHRRGRTYPVLPPANDIAHFEVSRPGGMPGDDIVLSGPGTYRFPSRLNPVFDAPEEISAGDLNLKTGEVTNLKYFLKFFNTSIYALGKADPKLEAETIRFPGTHGSSFAKLEQRAGGLLDFRFFGSTFLPLSCNEVGVCPKVESLCAFPV